MLSINLRTDSLQAALRLAKPVVPARCKLPILTFVRLTGDPETGVTLTATNLESAITIPVGEASPIPVAFDVCVPYQGLRAAVDKFKGPHVSISVVDDGTSVTVSAGATVTLATREPEDFPVMSAIAPEWGASLPAADLLRHLETVQHAISSEETRYYLQGIFLRAFADRLEFVATDGHRLAQSVLRGDFTPTNGIIIPADTVKALRVLLTRQTGNVAVEGNGTRVQFRRVADGAALQSKLIDGTFPDYERVIPRDPSSEMWLDAAAFSETIATVMAPHGRDAPPVKLDLTGTTLRISARAADTGETSAEIATESVGTVPVIGFRASYLRDALAQCGPGDAVLSFTDAGVPITVRPVGDDSRLFIILPFRV